MTKHAVVHEHIVTEVIDCESDYCWQKIYSVYKCLGCEEHILSLCESFSDWDEHGMNRKRFPATKNYNEPNWVYQLPRELQKIIKEVYTALQYDCYTLACSGLRTILDCVFTGKVGDLRTFEMKVDNMIQEGYIAGNQKEPIMAVIDAGSASAHRSFTPEYHLRQRAVRITENLLESIYAHPHDQRVLKESIPQRNTNKEAV
jgi:hypothetical protein